MSNFNFNTGSDCGLIMQSGTGQQIDIQFVKDFEPKPDKVDVVVKGMNGKRLTYFAVEGWSGKFTTTRQNVNLDKWFADQESAFLDLGVKQLGNLFQTITEGDGSETTFIYEDAALWLENPGKWEQDNKAVEMTVSFAASRRRMV